MAKVHVAFFLFVSWVQWGSEAQDDWKRSSFPNEELTSGNEVAPSETRWGHYIKVNVKTSKREFSSTSGSVYITFYGKRATSGNILLQKGFSSGSLDSIRILLDREIGVNIFNTHFYCCFYVILFLTLIILSSFFLL